MAAALRNAVKKTVASSSGVSAQAGSILKPAVPVSKAQLNVRDTALAECRIALPLPSRSVEARQC